MSKLSQKHTHKPSAALRLCFNYETHLFPILVDRHHKARMKFSFPVQGYSLISPQSLHQHQAWLLAPSWHSNFWASTMHMRPSTPSDSKREKSVVHNPPLRGINVSVTQCARSGAQMSATLVPPWLVVHFVVTIRYEPRITHPRLTPTNEIGLFSSWTSTFDERSSISIEIRLPTTCMIIVRNEHN